MTIDEVTLILTHIYQLKFDVDDNTEIIFHHSYYDSYTDSDVDTINTIRDTLNPNLQYKVYLTHEGLSHGVYMGIYHYQEFHSLRRFVIKYLSNDNEILTNYVVGQTNNSQELWNNNLLKYSNLNKLKNKL